MRDFFVERGPYLALVVLVMLATALAQTAISETFAVGHLRGRLPFDVAGIAAAGHTVRLGLVALMALLWLLGRKHALFRLVIVVNAIATAMLLVHVTALGAVLVGLSARAVEDLILDVALIALANVLIFSVWYWVLDPPGVDGSRHEDDRWAFLFPQRASELPGYANWVPHYVDYLFVAFTTSFAFSPTDTLPLSHTAKMLMLLQSTISVVTLTGIAGSAINILAGS